MREPSSVAIPRCLRDRDILESDYMDQRDSRYLIVNGRVVFRGGAYHNVTPSNKYQIGMVNVIAQALADDDSHGLEGLLAQTALYVFGSIHRFLSLPAWLL